MRSLQFALALMLLAVPTARAEEAAPSDPAKVALSTAFTYQGRLLQSDAPLYQSADLRFTLYDAVSGGAVVGSTIQLQNVALDEGLFSVELDYGSSVFTGDARWIQIEVRAPHDASNTQAFTTLTPRQEITAVPYALHALSAPGGGGSGPWQLSGSVVSNSSGNRVLVNRTNLITSSEYFGIYGPTSGYVGMYISTDDDGEPFYGYKSGSAPGMWTYQDGATGTWHVYNGGNRLSVLNSGEVEVGNGITLDDRDATSQGGEIVLRKSSGTVGARLNGATSTGTQGGSLALYNDTNSTATVVLDGEYGGAAGGALLLRNSNGNTSFEMGADFNPGERGIFRMYKPNGTKTIEIDTEETGDATQGSALKLYNDTGQLTIELDADYGSSNEGRVIASVIEITGGADFSENFDIRGPEGIVDPGSVVAIDPESPGELRLASEAYDFRVAGIVSGAGGVRPGMIMGQRGTEADGKHPVALTGRVYCKVDASYGAIQAGDLLTTSPTSGHAMKVTDPSKASGAILGKAMESFDAGKGLILVLVSLQ